MTNSDSLVLIVEDREALRYVTERILRNAGFRTAEAGNGEDALALARSLKPDVVLLDINLPDIDGYEVCKRLRADHATMATAIVQTSATFESAEHQVRGLEGGADTFLVAPVEPAVLVATVRAMLRLRRAEARLREFDRRKDEFLATLAHELRNPLAPVFYCLDLLEERGLDDAQAAETLGIMRRQTEHLHRLVDDLVDMSRITQNKLTLQVEPVALQEVLEAAVEACRPDLEARAQRLEIDLPASPIVLPADLVRLSQVFGNLLSNSIKYTGEGGRIRIEAERGPDAVEVTVADDGIGVSDEDLERIFELFVQAQRPGSGLGIGLALASRIVEMHGGSIRVSSEGRNRGSRFTVRLPLREQPSSSAPAAEPVPAVPAEALPSRRVLVVDDNTDAADSMLRLLETMNQQVRICYGGREAVDVAREFRPEVVFMDVAMPDMSGLESVAEIRRQAWSGGTVICALSGHGLPRDREASREAGADVHLVKPASLSELARVLLASRREAASPAKAERSEDTTE